jgi:hypothetical protein
VFGGAASKADMVAKSGGFVDAVEEFSGDCKVGPTLSDSSLDRQTAGLKKLSGDDLDLKYHRDE